MLCQVLWTYQYKTIYYLNNPSICATSVAWIFPYINLHWQYFWQPIRKRVISPVWCVKLPHFNNRSLLRSWFLYRKVSLQRIWKTVTSLEWANFNTFQSWNNVIPIMVGKRSKDTVTVIIRCEYYHLLHLKPTYEPLSNSPIKYNPNQFSTLYHIVGYPYNKSYDTPRRTVLGNQRAQWWQDIRMG